MEEKSWLSAGYRTLDYRLFFYRIGGLVASSTCRPIRDTFRIFGARISFSPGPQAANESRVGTADWFCFGDRRVFIDQHFPGVPGEFAALDPRRRFCGHYVY